MVCFLPITLWLVHSYVPRSPVRAGTASGSDVFIIGMTIPDLESTPFYDIGRYDGDQPMLLRVTQSPYSEAQPCHRAVILNSWSPTFWQRPSQIASNLAPGLGKETRHRRRARDT